MHLSSIDKPWGKPFTDKRYLHPPFAENIITMWPNSMVMIGEIEGDGDPHSWIETEEFDKGYGPAAYSAGVIFTIKRENDLLFNQRQSPRYKQYTWDHDFMPRAGVRYKHRNDGIPIHSLTKNMDAVKFHQEVFCDSKRVSTAYIKVTVENNFGISQKIELGLLARTGPEFLLTGCWEPDGYDQYTPSRQKWDAKEMIRYEKNDGYLTDGKYKLYFDKKENFIFDSENDLNIVLDLKPYEKRNFTFAFTRNSEAPKPYKIARKETEIFWKRELGKAKNIPDKKGIEPLFYNFLAQELQMFACPIGKDYTIMRQGANQRYHWPEAKEIIKALSRIDGYADYIDAGISHYFNDMQEKEGENIGRIFYEYVPWNSRTAASLEMFNYAVRCDESFFDKYIEQAMLGLRWMERERAKSAEIDGAYAGVFPPGIATDNFFDGSQQWTFADTSMLLGYEAFLRILKEKNSKYVDEVEAAYNDYFGVMKKRFDEIAEEQKDSEFLYIPRDIKNIPEIEEELNKGDPFVYLFPNQVLESGIAGYGTENAEKLIYTYSYGGQSQNGLVQPMYRSTTGVGRVWYTTWAEYSRYIYYARSGNRKKCKELIDALLKYNVTTEFYQCERYDDHDAYYSPWLPNASANGRVLDMLFDYYGKRSL